MVIAYADGLTDSLFQLPAGVVHLFFIIVIVRIYICLAGYAAVRFKLPVTVLAVAPAHVAVLCPCRADEIVELFLNPRILGLIIGIKRGFFFAHLEPVPVDIRSRIVQEIQPVSTVIHHHIPASLCGREREQAACLFRLVVHGYKAYRYSCVIVLFDFIQLVIHHVHIALPQLYIGVKRCLRRTCTVDFPAVHISLNGYVQSPGRLIGCFMVRIVVASHLDGIGFGSAYIVLSVNHLIGHVRMVHVHQLPVRVRGQFVLQNRYLVRIQGQLLTAAAPDFIHHNSVAGGCRPFIYRCQHQVGVRHGKAGFPGVNLGIHSIHRSDGELPV